jgi:colanic acid/amylovoran biosynthesis glycosyltransferase
MGAVRKVLHLKYQSLGPYESFLEELLMSSQDFKPEFWYLKEAANGRKSPVDSRKFESLSRLWSCADISSFDLIHAHFGTSALLALPLVYRDKLPLVVSFYGHDFTAFPRRWLGLGGFLLRRVFKEATTLIAMSKPMGQELIRLGAPGFKIEIGLPGLRKVGFRKDPVTRVDRLLMGSALKEKKNHALVLRSLRLLKDRGLKLRLWILGDGPLKPALEVMVRSLGIQGQVGFEGSYCGTSELYRYFRGSDLFLHPSKRARNGDGEGVPTAILEALGAGMPVLTSKHAGLDQVFSDSVLTVNEHSVEELSSTLARLCTRPEILHPYQIRAQLWAQEHLNPRDLLLTREAIYSRALEGIKKNTPGFSLS